MSTRSRRPSEGPNNLTIDLTGDSDEPTASENLAHLARGRHASFQVIEEENPLAPRFIPRLSDDRHVIIDLADDSDFQGEEFEIHSDREAYNSELDSERGDQASYISDDTSSSPDVQILHERPAPGAAGHRQPPRAAPLNRPLSPPQERGPFGYFPDLLRRGTQLMVGNAYQDVILDHLDPVRNRGNDNQQGLVAPRMEAGGAFPIALDYSQPAFPLGELETYDRSSETPQIVHEPYKAPPPAKEGFTRTFAEDDVVLCPGCGDELATGKDETKQQVWIVKSCGHVSYLIQI